MTVVRKIIRRLRQISSDPKDNLACPPSIRSRYKLPKWYRHRNVNDFFDDTVNKDKFQDEVYREAAALASDLNAPSILDIGCGSAFKLMKYFKPYSTLGLDLPPTVERLNEMYPDRSWRYYDLSARPSLVCDIVICADVIEHVADPDELLSFMENIDFKVGVISTPDRDLVYGGTHYGPPINRAHCREWNSDEFRSYIGERFNVRRSFISNAAQSTQLIVFDKG